MSKSFCVYCGANLEPDAVFCVMCGQAVPVVPQAPVPVETYDPLPPMPDPSGAETIVAEDWDALLAPADVVLDAEPAPTIIEEPEPVTALVRLEIKDAEAGDMEVDFELGEGGNFTIGRDGRVTDYAPADPRASRRHFSITVSSEGLCLVDLGSSNGTFVNGAKVSEPTWLNDGDSIEYGHSSAIVRVLRMPEGASGASGAFYL